MNYRKINVSIPGDLLDVLDEIAAKEGMTRSLFIRHAVEDKLIVIQYLDKQMEDENSGLHLVQRMYFAKKANKELRSRRFIR